MPSRQISFVALSLIAVFAAVPGIAGQATVDTPAPAAPTTAAVPAPATAAAAATPPSAADTPVAVSSATAAEAKKITCRNERVTGSNFRTRKVCTTPNSQDASGNWVRDQQDRGAIGASAILNSAGGG